MIAGHFAPTAALWRRDLVRTMRKRRSGVFLGLYAGLLAVMIINSWPRDDMTPYMVQNYAESTLVLFVFLSYSWVAMIMPPYGATAITQEHERDTMEMLSMSLVPSWGVVLGKWGAHTGLFLFVLLAAMPVMAASTFFTVGTEIPTFLALVGLIASTSVACVAIGVAFSSITKSSKSAVIFSYVGVAMMLGLPILLYAAIVEFLFDFADLFGVDAEETIIYLTRYFTPIGATFHILEGTLEWYDYIAVQMYLWAVSLFAFLFACWRYARFNKVGLLSRRAAKPKSKPTRTVAPRPFVPMGDRGNAWYAREVRFGSLMRGRIRWGVFGGGCAVFGLIALSLLIQHLADPGWGNEYYIEAWVGVGLVALAVVLPGIGANAFSREFDGSRMDLLRGTLLTPRDYVLGSVQSTVRSIIPLCMSIVVTTIILGPVFVGDSQMYNILLTGLGSAIATILLGTTVGIAAGTITRRTATALTLAYASAFTIFVGSWIAVSIVAELTAWVSVRSGIFTYGEAPKLTTLKEMALISSPILAYLNNLDDPRSGDIINGYWWRSVGLGLAFSVAFSGFAMLGFRYRLTRDD